MNTNKRHRSRLTNTGTAAAQRSQGKAPHGGLCRRLLRLCVTAACLLALSRTAQADILSILHSFIGIGGTPGGNPTDGRFPVAGLIEASDGNFYGTTQNGGETIIAGQQIVNFGTVYQIPPQEACPRSCMPLLAHRTAPILKAH